MIKYLPDDYIVYRLEIDPPLCKRIGKIICFGSTYYDLDDQTKSFIESGYQIQCYPSHLSQLEGWVKSHEIIRKATDGEVAFWLLSQ